MKNKFYRHLVFWLASSVQGTLLEYAWIHTVYANEHAAAIIMQALCFNLALTPSRLFFTYYALNAVAGKSFKGNLNVWAVFLKLGVAMVIAVTLHRMASAFYIIPHEFPTRAAYTWQELFSPPWMFVSLLDIGYVAGIAVALKLFRMQIISLKNEKDLVRDKLETELKFLKNQINPHFLFNTLNNIYALARKKANETPEVVVKLANLLRFMLYESAKNKIAISEEIKILDDYVQLEKIRFSKRLEVGFRKELDDYSQQISPLILLPFVENAFKHGVNDTVKMNYINIDIILNRGQLMFLVENSHDHRSNSTINENIGLQNIRRQLELTYTEFSLDITKLEQTFLVNLKINLNSNGKL